MNAKLFPCTYAIPCDIYGCGKTAKWFIGRADAPLNCTYKVCQSCAESIARTMPQEVLPPPETPVIAVESLVITNGTITAPVMPTPKKPTARKPPKKPPRGKKQ